MVIKELSLRSVGTHDGSFHADEVTACGLLLLFGLVDREKIVRSREPELLAKCEYVCDVGGVYDPEIKRFDHHQVSYQGDLSSAGMVLLYLRDTGKIDPSTYEFFNRSLILGVERMIRHVTIPDGRLHLHGIANFVPPQYDAPEEMQNRFSRLDFVSGHLKRLLNVTVIFWLAKRGLEVIKNLLIFYLKSDSLMESF
jgi:uncharacterized UPF0160 family protein